MTHYICLNAGRHGIQVHGSCKADSVEEAIELWVDPEIGYVPEHIGNTFDAMVGDNELTAEQIKAYNDKDHPKYKEVCAIVKEEAIKRTKDAFGLGPPKETWVLTEGTVRRPKERKRMLISGDGYGREWAIIEIDEEGNTKTYPDI